MCDASIMRHTVVISDIHLSETERTDGLWMRYRQEAYSPDGELASMLQRLRGEVRGGELTLVLNGDVFDLDAPRVVGQESVFHDLPRDADHALPMIEAILDDHPVFVAALGAVLAEGHAIVLVSGNHDVQLTLPEVRALVSERLVAAAIAAGGDRPESAEAIRARVAFRAWFHKTADNIVIEHGNQYDGYCSYRYPMEPFGKDPREIQPTMGSLTTRHLISRMGFFNPHVDSSFMLSAAGYFAHWARYYLFSRRSLAVAWATGALRIVAELARRRDPERRDRRRRNIAAAAAETGVPLRVVARHARLFASPAEDRLAQVLRELWLDRVALATAAAVFALVWLVVARGAMLGAVALAPALLVAYELAVPKGTLEQTWRRVQRVARHVARAHKASAVVFGHTHRAEGAWEEGVFFGNTGSWSAAYKDLECTELLVKQRPIVWLTSDDGRIEGGLATWSDGSFTRPGG